MSKLTAEEKIVKAKVDLDRTNPFFAYLVMHLDIREDKNNAMAMPTMCVNSIGTLTYNKQFVDSLEEEVLKSVLTHEAFHVAMFHTDPDRVSGRDTILWNYAVDVITNYYLLQNGFKLPPDCILPKPNGSIQLGNVYIKDIGDKTSEMIYDEIERQVPKSKWGNFLESLGKMKRFDEHIFDKLVKAAASGDSEAKDLLARAAQYAKMKGDQPLGMDRLIDTLLNPQLDWKQLLNKYIVQEIPFDYRFFPSRRSLAIGSFYPSVSKDTIDITVAIDTSGSISESDLADFLSEIKAIISMNENVNVDLLMHDTEIHKIHKLSSRNQSEFNNVKIIGGGGTSHKAVLEYVSKSRSKLLVCFTDGYSDLEILKPPLVPSIFVINNSDQKVPFGKVVRIKSRVR